MAVCHPHLCHVLILTSRDYLLQTGDTREASII